MSGHSKWATIKHKKGAADKARGKLFNKLTRQIEVAARAGGGDADANPTLRTAVQKAKGAQMTNESIERAIKRGTGEGDTGVYEAIMYEGYAPGGVALLIDVLTDNRNRTGSEIRGVFTRFGGSLAEPGAVELAVHPARRRDGRRRCGRGRRSCWPRSRRGPTTSPTTVEVGGSPPTRPERSMSRPPSRMPGSRSSRPTPRWCRTTLVPVTSAEEAKKVLRIVEAIEENDDVQDVYSNFDIADELLTELMETVQ